MHPPRQSQIQKLYKAISKTKERSFVFDTSALCRMEGSMPLPGRLDDMVRCLTHRIDALKHPHIARLLCAPHLFLANTARNEYLTGIHHIERLAQTAPEVLRTPCFELAGHRSRILNYFGEFCVPDLQLLQQIRLQAEESSLDSLSLQGDLDIYSSALTIAQQKKVGLVTADEDFLLLANVLGGHSRLHIYKLTDTRPFLRVYTQRDYTALAYN